MSARTATVLLIDDHPIICDGAALTLEQDGRFSRVIKANDLDTALQLGKDLPPDLIVLDFVLGGRDGTEAIRDLREQFPQAKILVFSAYPESVFAPLCYQAGAAGYLVKTDRPEKLPEKLWELFTSPHPQSPPASARSSTSWPDLASLGTREMQVFVRMGEGKTTSEIASELNLSEKTVFSHKENIKQKLGALNSHQLMRLAITFSLSQGTAGFSQEEAP